MCCPAHLFPNTPRKLCYLENSRGILLPESIGTTFLIEINHNGITTFLKAKNDISTFMVFFSLWLIRGTLPDLHQCIPTLFKNQTFIKFFWSYFEYVTLLINCENRVCSYAFATIFALKQKQHYSFCFFPSLFHFKILSVKNVLPNTLKQNFVYEKSELCEMNSLSVGMYPGTRKTCPVPADSLPYVLCGTSITPEW